MARLKFKKKNIKQLVSAVLVCILIAGIAGLVAAVKSNDMKRVHPTSFDIGALDTSGKKIKSDNSLYTDDFIECQGLTVDVSTTDNVKYEVFYFREDKTLIDSTGTLTDAYEKGGTFANAKYAKIVITPELKEGDEKITFWNKLNYARFISVKVLKDQSFEAPLISIDDNVRKNYVTNIDGVTYNAVLLTDGPFVPENMADYSGKTIKRISIPVAGVIDHTVDSVLSVYVLTGNGSTTFKKVQEIELIIPAYTFNASLGEYDLSNNEVKNGADAIWYEFDVNIKLEADQVLGFSDNKDSVSFVYRRGFTEDSNHYDFYNDALVSPSRCNSLSVYFDVEYLE